MGAGAPRRCHRAFSPAQPGGADRVAQRHARRTGTAPAAEPAATGHRLFLRQPDGAGLPAAVRRAPAPVLRAPAPAVRPRDSRGQRPGGRRPGAAPTASAPPASPGSPASAARAASRSRAAWPSSSPAPTWVTCPSISPRPGWRAAACARCPASGISPCSFVWPTIAAIPPARRRRPSPTICWTRSASDEARALHLLKHPGSIVVVPSSPHLLEYT